MIKKKLQPIGAYSKGILIDKKELERMNSPKEFFIIYEDEKIILIPVKNKEGGKN